MGNHGGFLLCLFLMLGVHSIRGDVYMHNPRGSNNKLNEVGGAL